MAEFDTVTVNELDDSVLQVASFLAYGDVNGKLYKTTIQDFAAFIKPLVKGVNPLVNGYLTGASQTGSSVSLDYTEKYNWYLERDTGFSVNLTTGSFGDNGVKYLVVKNINTNTAIAISVVFNNALVNIRGTAMRIYAQGYGEISFKLELGANGATFITVMFNSQEIDITV